MIDQAQDVASSIPQQNISQPAPAPAPAPAPVSQEKMLPQSQVNDLVKAAKAEAYERAQRDLANSMQSSPQHQMSNSGLTHEEARRIASEEIQNQAMKYKQEVLVDSMANKF